MSPATLEAYIRQLLESHRDPNITVEAGRGTTFTGVDFFRRAIDLVEQHRKPGQRIQHTFQTNGIALDGEWCAFLTEGPVDAVHPHRRARHARDHPACQPWLA